MRKIIDMTGQKLGRLIPLNYAGKNSKKEALWLCACECGNKIIVNGCSLRKGITKSCGCLNRDIVIKRNYKHGNWGTPLNNLWKGIHARCSNPRTKNFKWYGAKGISVCEDWKDFSKFRDWAISAGYSKGLTIDRINPNGNYCPENCEWVTRAENTLRMHLTKKLYFRRLINKCCDQ